MDNSLAHQIKNSFCLHEELLSLAEFCKKNNLDCPRTRGNMYCAPLLPVKKRGSSIPRWDMENQGFNTQKNHGSYLEYLFSRNGRLNE